jgi:hypothetical protein
VSTFILSNVTDSELENYNLYECRVIILSMQCATEEILVEMTELLQVNMVIARDLFLRRDLFLLQHTYPRYTESKK